MLHLDSRVIVSFSHPKAYPYHLPLPHLSAILYSFTRLISINVGHSLYTPTPNDLSLTCPPTSFHTARQLATRNHTFVFDPSPLAVTDDSRVSRAVESSPVESDSNRTASRNESPQYYYFIPPPPYRIGIGLSVCSLLLLHPSPGAPSRRKIPRPMRRPT